MEDKIIDLMSKLETALVTYTPVAYEKLIQLVFFKSAAEAFSYILGLVFVTGLIYIGIKLLRKGAEVNKGKSAFEQQDAYDIFGCLIIGVGGVLGIGLATAMVINWETYLGIVSPESRMILMLLNKVLA